MKLAIVLLILAALVWYLGSHWMYGQMDKDIQSKPPACMDWVRDHPIKGCE